MRRPSFIRRCCIAVAVMSVMSLLAAAGAQAIVVNDQGVHAGVAVVPGTASDLAGAGVSRVTATVSSCDPWLSADLSPLPSLGLCWQGASVGGSVVHDAETFALTWDPTRDYWTGTRDYVEQFLKDVADGSGSLSSPYAVTTQYRDSTGRAQNQSKYGGACIDLGNPGGYTCQFGDTTGTGVGNNYPSSACPLDNATTHCLTDNQIQSEVNFDLTQTQLAAHLVAGYTPMLVLLTPSNVRVCLDSAGNLCSADGVAHANHTAQFCSYHSYVTVGAIHVPYVVQPWTAGTACDEPKLPPTSATSTAQELAIDAGSRLVNPLSQGQIAATVNPTLTGWYADDGSEINDNGGCVPDGDPADSVTIGKSAQNPYFLAPEFNNAGVIDTDPDVPQCALGVALAPTFVMPSAVDAGDEVQFDGSTTDSTLIVPKDDYGWSFGDGKSSVGPSVVHTFDKPGTYPVTLTVMDRGGNFATVSETMTVLGANDQQAGGPGSSKRHGQVGLRARVELLPQGMQSMLRTGIATRLTTNERATGFVTLSIPRSAAHHAGIRTGHSRAVVIGRGTVSQVKKGTVKLHLRLSHTVATKLKHLSHIALTVRLALVSPSGDRLTIDAAGRY